MGQGQGQGQASWKIPACQAAFKLSTREHHADRVMHMLFQDSSWHATPAESSIKAATSSLQTATLSRQPLNHIYIYIYIYICVTCKCDRMQASQCIAGAGNSLTAFYSQCQGNIQPAYCDMAGPPDSCHACTSCCKPLQVQQGHRRTLLVYLQPCSLCASCPALQTKLECCDLNCKPN